MVLCADESSKTTIALVHWSGLLLLAIAVYFYPFNSTLYVDGGKDSVNALIFIDGHEADRMSSEGVGAGAIVSIKPGNHKLKVINQKGQSFEQEFSIHGENYIAVVFKDSTK